MLLPQLGEMWVQLGEGRLAGNCVTCVSDLIKSMTRPRHGASPILPSSAVQAVERAAREDCMMDPRFENVHMQATTGHPRLGYSSLLSRFIRLMAYVSESGQNLGMQACFRLLVAFLCTRPL